MDVQEVERILTGILRGIEYIEAEMENMNVIYYLEKPVRVNGITIEVSLFDIIQHIKLDYQKEVLDRFYDMTERIGC